VVLRGGGLSMDGQAVGDDIAVSLEAFDELSFDPVSGRLTVGAGVRWGDIGARLEPFGWIPPVVITARSATVGGTLGSNCLSRFSPLWGKEGKSVVSIDLMTPDGAIHRASRDRSPELFRAAIGGFGGVGVILGATYALRRVPTPTVVRSQVIRHASFDGLERLCGPAGVSDERTAFAIVSVGAGSPRALVLQSDYVAAEPLRPMLPHAKASPLRVPIELLVNRFHALSSLFWAFTHEVYMRATDARPFIDDLQGFTFFMDGHARAKAAADRLGVAFPVVQQAFIIPRDEDLAPFLRRAVEVFLAAGVPVSLLDIIWLPRDEPFCLSSTRNSSGYAATFSFEGHVSLPRLRDACYVLGNELAALGGRIHLVKNVFVPPERLAADYAEGLAEYAAVKRRVDPDAVLRNEFLERCFPSLFARA
jgi:hypothetical protein